MYYGYHGLMGLVIIIVLAIVLFSVIRSMSGGSCRTKSAREILDERYASGDISREEYEQKKKDIS